jgi:Fic family protein
MRVFNYKKLIDLKLTMETVSYLTEIDKYNKQQEFFIQQKPNILNQLIKTSKIDSIETSNKLEGISTSGSRLKYIVEEKIEPKTRNEEEIAGYRDVLKIIHESYDEIKISDNYILQLHKILLSHLNNSNGGKFKNTNNFIQETKEDGTQFIRFKPLSALETPQAVKDICSQYNEASKNSKINKLILIFTFVLDFLCIHPFDDGNGRISRILTLLLMYKNRYMIGRYISIEKQIEETKDGYYNSLLSSSIDWYKNTNDAFPFINYMLFVVLETYKLFNKKTIETVSKNKSKPELIKELFDNHIG